MNDEERCQLRQTALSLALELLSKSRVTSLEVDLAPGVLVAWASEIEEYFVNGVKVAVTEVKGEEDAPHD